MSEGRQFASGSAHIEITEEGEGYPIAKGAICALVSTVLDSEGAAWDEVALHFVEMETICHLHEKFFDDPSPTDCITLPLEPDPNSPYRHLGDVFICPEAARNWVETEGGNWEAEVARYVVHGLLHLLGYEDKTESGQAQMRSLEEHYCTKLRRFR